jgi:hypothetical protein
MPAAMSCGTSTGRRSRPSTPSTMRTKPGRQRCSRRTRRDGSPSTWRGCRSCSGRPTTKSRQTDIAATRDEARPLLALTNLRCGRGTARKIGTFEPSRSCSSGPGLRFPKGISMKIRGGYEISYDCSQPTPMILTLSVHPFLSAGLPILPRHPAAGAIARRRFCARPRPASVQF